MLLVQWRGLRGDHLRGVDIDDSLILRYILKLGRFGQQIRNTWKVLKHGAGEG